MESFSSEANIETITTKIQIPTKIPIPNKANDGGASIGGVVMGSDVEANSLKSDQCRSLSALHHSTALPSAATEKKNGTLYNEHGLGSENVGFQFHSKQQ